jgi:hypothetical protein
MSRTTYFPNTPDLATAQPIVLAGGAERTAVDIGLRTTPAVTIKGKIIGGLSNTQSGGFSLVPQDPEGRRKYKHAAEGTVGRSEAAASEFYLLCKLFGVSTGYICCPGLREPGGGKDLTGVAQGFKTQTRAHGLQALNVFANVQNGRVGSGNSGPAGGARDGKSRHFRILSIASGE